MSGEIRTPSNGQPYYCKTCGLAWSEYMACEETDCELESTDEALARIQHQNGRIPKMERIDFETWLTQLKAICKSHDVEDYVEQTGEQCWREMYADGMTPEEAWSEEVAAAQQLG